MEIFPLEETGVYFEETAQHEGEAALVVGSVYIEEEFVSPEQGVELLAEVAPLQEEV